MTESIYVVSWLPLHRDAHDETFGPFPNYDEAADFAASLPRTAGHAGFVIEALYPPAEAHRTHPAIARWQSPS